MIYPFHCNSCEKEFELDMSYEEYLSHAPRREGNRVVSKFFCCSECGSFDTRRDYLYTSPTIFKGEGFTKSVKEEEE